jgi:hypothetical protein
VRLYAKENKPGGTYSSFSYPKRKTIISMPGISAICSSSDGSNQA